MQRCGRLGTDRRRRSVIWSWVPAWALLLPGIATAARPTSALEAQGVIEEVTVTVRRREERLQDAPVAVTAISAAQLDQRDVLDISGIAQIVPNLTFNSTTGNSGSSNAAVVFIRGVGQDDFFPTIDPGVGIYLDGVYVSRTLGAVLDTVDLQQVEVLRGPQGTLFGKNTIGGAIQLTTRRPDDTFGGSMEVTTGRFERLDVKASVDLPIGDKLRTRLSVARLNRDGYVTIVERQPNGSIAATDAPKLGDINSLSSRFTAEWLASDALTATFSADYTRKREESAGTTLLSTAPAIAGPTPGSIDVNASLGTIGGFHNFIAAIADGCSPLAGGNPFDQANPACFNNQWITGDPYTTFYDPARSRSDLDLWGVSAILDWRGSGFGFKSISAFRTTTSQFLRDDNTPLLLLELETKSRAEQLSQELQFSGEAMSDRLQWLVGLYYLNEKVRYRNPACFSFVCAPTNTDLDTDSYAIFTQETFAFTDRLNVTLGARYTREEKTSHPDNFYIDSGFGLPPFPNPNPNPLTILDTPASLSFNKFTPQASLDFHWSGDIMTYVSVSKGFKSGGFQQRLIAPRLEQPTFGPEELDSYEIGLKANGLDRRIQANLAVFYSEYHDLQITVFNPGNIEPLQVNGGEAEIKGFELELAAVPTARFSTSLAIGLVDTEYTRLAPAATIPPNAKLPFTPEWTVSGNTDYVIANSAMGSWNLHVDGSYRSKTYFNATNSPDIAQAGYTVANAAVSFEATDERWLISLGCTNLTNKAYLLSGFSDLGASTLGDGVYSRPREWSVRGKWTF